MFVHSALSSIRSYLGESRGGKTSKGGHKRPNRDANNKGRPNKSRPRQTNQATNNQEEGAGVAEEDRGGEGCTNHIRIAIEQLSGVQCGTWIIVQMNTSVWPN